jgi:hypothetical protein
MFLVFCDDDIIEVTSPRCSWRIGNEDCRAWSQAQDPEVIVAWALVDILRTWAQVWGIWARRWVTVMNSPRWYTSLEFAPLPIPRDKVTRQVSSSIPSTAEIRRNAFQNLVPEEIRDKIYLYRIGCSSQKKK